MSRLLVLLVFVLGPAARAQPATGEPPQPEGPAHYGSGIGGSLLLTNYGFGLGGVWRGAIGEATSLVVDLSIGSGKDEREQEFFIGFFGETVVPFKRSYFLMAPLHVGLERRLFREQIEDSFRPFVQMLAGPAFGYQWPYFEDANGNGRREAEEERLGALGGFGDGSVRVGVGGTIALGAYFGESRRATQGIRIGYIGSYFFRAVDLLEERPEVERPSQHFFGTPIVSLYILRLF